jgi:hypothetical protein
MSGETLGGVARGALRARDAAGARRAGALTVLIEEGGHLLLPDSQLYWHSGRAPQPPNPLHHHHLRA